MGFYGIGILLRCNRGDGSKPDMDIPSEVKAFNALIEEGAIKKNGDLYVTTQLGLVWLLAMGNVPAPRLAYVDGSKQWIQYYQPEE